MISALSGKTLLAFALLHSAFACYSRYLLTSYFLYPEKNPKLKKTHVT